MEPKDILFVNPGPVYAKVLGGDAGYLSELRWGDNAENLIAGDRDHHVASKVGDLSWEQHFWIVTPQTGTRYDNLSNHALVSLESPGVWLICFEDGGDFDYNDLVVRVWQAGCGSESLGASTANSDFEVVYDPHFIADPTDDAYLTTAAAVANQVLAEATSARAEMAARYATFGAGSEVSGGGQITIELTCSPRNVNGDLVQGNGVTVVIGTPVVRLKATAIRDWVANSNPSWSDVLHHELIHVYQSTFYASEMLHLLKANTLVESTAQAGSDLLETGDDTSSGPESFLAAVAAAAAKPDTSPAFVRDYDEQLPYRSAGLFQYLGERFGDASLPTLEDRVAGFLRQLYSNFGPFDGSGWRSATDAIGADGEGQLVDAIRDYYVALIAHLGANAGDLPDRFRILDEVVPHGAEPGPAPVAWPELIPTSMSGPETWVQQPGTTHVAQIAVTSGQSILHFSLRQADARGTAARLAFVPVASIAGEDSYLVRAENMKTGPKAGGALDYAVDVAGMDRVIVVSVAGSDAQTSEASFSFDTGSPALTIAPIASVMTGRQVAVQATISVSSTPVRLIDPSALSATVDSGPATIGSLHDTASGAQVLVVGVAADLQPGTHALQIHYTGLGSQVSGSGQFSVTAGSQPVQPRLISIDAGSATAGMPLAPEVALLDPAGALAGREVSVSVTDPGGTTRTHAMGDDGGPSDGLAGDGAYSAMVFGTTAPGTYSLQFNASGTDRDGQPFTTALTLQVVVAPGADTDQDGIADALEVQLGLDPLSPADASRDLDRDGLGTAAEIAIGTDPVAPDTDEGGEIDGSEAAAGRDPLAPSDDVHLTPPSIVADPGDGRTVEIYWLTAPGRSVHLYRQAEDGTTADLGVSTQSTGSMSDGPLSAGTYTYLAAAMSGGATSTMGATGAVRVADDVTPPSARLLLANGDVRAAGATAPAEFIDAAGSPAEMRLAESLSALSAAAWLPFVAQTTYTFSPVAGFHTLFAQVRDAAANESGVFEDAVILDLAAPTSSAGPAEPSTFASSIWLSCTAADDDQVDFIQLWSRYRAGQTGSWGAWEQGGDTRDACPMIASFGHGDGDYEFATTAVDRAGNREAMPAAGDVQIHRGAVVEQVSDPATGGQGAARIALGRDGRLHAVWVDPRNSASLTDIYYARREGSGTTWSANERVDDAAVAATSPSVAADAAGNVYALWVDGRRGDPDIWFSKRSASTGAWSASVRVNDDAAGSTQGSPVIAVAPSGVATAVWFDGRSRKVALYSARLPANGVTWDANVRVTSDTTNDKSEPDLVVDGSGNADAVWRQAKNGVWGVWFSSLASGGSAWSGQAKLNTLDVTMTMARIAADASGRLMVAYVQSPTSVWVQHRAPGGTWTAPATVSLGGQVTSLAASYEASGRAYLVGVAGGQVVGLGYTPGTNTWSSSSTVTTSGTHGALTTAAAAGRATTLSVDGSGTGATIRAYPVTIP